MCFSYRKRDVFGPQSSGTYGQTFTVMMDICSWTGETYVCVCVLLCTWHVGYHHFLCGGSPL